MLAHFLCICITLPLVFTLREAPAGELPTDSCDRKHHDRLSGPLCRVVGWWGISVGCLLYVGNYLAIMFKDAKQV